jgi:hypothetical protein
MKETTMALEIVDLFIPVDVVFLPLLGLDNFYSIHSNSFVENGSGY